MKDPPIILEWQMTPHLVAQPTSTNSYPGFLAGDSYKALFWISPGRLNLMPFQGITGNWKWQPLDSSWRNAAVRSRGPCAIFFGRSVLSWKTRRTRSIIDTFHYFLKGCPDQIRFQDNKLCQGGGVDGRCPPATIIRIVSEQGSSQMTIPYSGETMPIEILIVISNCAFLHMN